MIHPSQLVRKHLDNALREAEREGIPADVLARAMMHLAIEIYGRERSVEDVRSELSFLADNLDEDETYPFMRP